NSLWAVAFFAVGVGLCRLLPEFHGAVRVILAIAIAGIAGFLAFLMTIDVPMYLNRWRTGDADGDKRLTPREGLRDVSTRWVVTHFLRWRIRGCATVVVERLDQRGAGRHRMPAARRIVGEADQVVGAVEHPLRHQMRHLFGAALDIALDQNQAGAHHFFPVLL